MRRLRPSAPRRDHTIPAPIEVGEPLAEVQEVTVTVGPWTLVQDASLDVRAGELVCVVGPNGAGKSTLIGVLSGDHRASSGQVRIAGVPVDELGPVALARRRAVLPQHQAISFPFTVSEVVTMGRAPWEGTEAVARDAGAVSEAMDAVDVAHLASRQVPTLSGGERARTALARVLAQQAQLLVLDEPTAALDLRHQELTLRVVAQRVAAGAGAVLVLHDLGLAAAYAHRLVLLGEGRVLADGPPREVLDRKRLTSVYGCPVDIVDNPRTGTPLVVPHRAAPQPFTAEEIDAVVAHMNDDHAEDCLLICRWLGGAPEARTARMVGMDGLGADFDVEVAGAPRPVRIPWSRELRERKEVREEAVDLVARARQRCEQQAVGDAPVGR